MTALAGCTSFLDTASPQIEAPSSALIDEEINMKLSDFASDTKVTITATTQYDGIEWESQATFRTDADGTVALNEQQPLSGTYSSVDGMGLFWSMSPSQSDETSTSSPTTSTAGSGQTTTDSLKRNRERVVQLRAESNGTTRASTEITRRVMASNVTVRTVGENDLVGRFYEPSGNGPHPGVLALHGSGANVLDGFAGLLASHGYAVLALQYFGAEGLPPTLSEIPLRYFTTAIEWLTDREEVATDGIGIVGVSRGAELALLLGSRETNTKVKTVIGYAPSGYVFPSTSGGTSAWAVNGKPVPYIPNPPTTPVQFSEDGTPILRPVFRKALNTANAETKRKATIPVDNIDGSVLLISGRDDALWPSTFFSRNVIERLDESGHSQPYNHLSYKNAGHGISYPYVPTTQSTKLERYMLGGTPVGNAHAGADSWPRVLDYLEKALAPTTNSRN